ncbi:MAG: hypothetical protein DRJ03_00770 [Chloroflexi bacterium]|nr:MAG: hypothetical protein DRJ03_00770 [Chloroflexota bacterium]
MSKTSKPELMQQFEHMLWVNSPKDWILKTTYFQGTLFVSMLIEAPAGREYQKIRRNFGFDLITERAFDLWGLASDCVDEMKTEVKN